MDNEENKVELHLVGNEKNDDEGIVLLEDDSISEKGKTKAKRLLSKVSDMREPKKKKLPAIAFICMIVFMLGLVYAIVDYSLGGALYVANGKLMAIIYGDSTDDFSVDIDSDNVYDMIPYARAFAYLSDKGISYINSSGKVTSSQQITYSSPAIVVNGKRAIIYDRGNDVYSIHQNQVLTGQYNASGKIITAAISSKKNYALAIRDEYSHTALYGYDEPGNVIYQWNCPEGYIYNISLNSSGGKSAVSIISSKNAVLQSYVYILDFDYDSEYAKFEFPNETVLGTKFISNKKIIVVTEAKVYLINEKEISVLSDFSSSDIYLTDMTGGMVAVVSMDYSHDDSYNLTVYNSNGKLAFTAYLNGKVRGVSASSKCVSVLYSDKIETYSNKGKIVGSIQNINMYDDIILNGNYVYLLSSDSVKKMPAFGTSSSKNQTAEEAQTDKGG